MPDHEIRGHLLSTAAAYIDGFDQGERAWMWDAVSAETRTLAREASPGEWYEGRHLEELFGALFETAGSPKRGVARVIGCGEAFGQVAIAGALRLVAKLLTPKVFASRSHKFFRRDFNFGRVDVAEFDAEAGRMVMVVSDVEGFQLVGYVAAGWFGYALKAMGQKNVQAEVVDLPVEMRAPAAWTLHITWRS
ncbi:MAG: hypothetical protein AAF721_36915 [Myxococcota bacterium]